MKKFQFEIVSVLVTKRLGQETLETEDVYRRKNRMLGTEFMVIQEFQTSMGQFKPVSDRLCPENKRTIPKNHVYKASLKIRRKAY